jgi:hypothetical protein
VVRRESTKQAAEKYQEILKTVVNGVNSEAGGKRKIEVVVLTFNEDKEAFKAGLAGTGFYAVDPTDMKQRAAIVRTLDVRQAPGVSLLDSMGVPIPGGPVTSMFD